MNVNEFADMSNPNPEDRWQSIDIALFANQIIPALKQIKVLTGASLPEACGILYERYAKLRSEMPDRFVCSNREYWVNFYTDGPPPPMSESPMPDMFDL